MRFSLLGIIVAVLIIAVGLGWWVDSSEKQQKINSMNARFQTIRNLQDEFDSDTFAWIKLRRKCEEFSQLPAGSMPVAEYLESHRKLYDLNIRRINNRAQFECALQGSEIDKIQNYERDQKWELTKSVISHHRQLVNKLDQLNSPPSQTEYDLIQQQIVHFESELKKYAK